MSVKYIVKIPGYAPAELISVKRHGRKIKTIEVCWTNVNSERTKTFVYGPDIKILRKLTPLGMFYKKLLKKLAKFILLVLAIFKKEKSE